MMFLEGLVWFLLGVMVGSIASVLIYAYVDYKVDKDIEKSRKGKGKLK